nr:unnamed protein product [Callosobruchus analis]
MHYIGDEGFQIFTSFKLEDEDRDKLAPVLRKFDEHFLGKENVAYERYQFFTYRQSEGQSTDDYIVQLKNKARRCKLEELQDSLIVTMLTCGVRNHKVRERLLQDDNLSLDKAVELCQVMESATAHSHMMGQRTQAVPGYSSVETVYNRSKSTNNKVVKNCKKCGKNEHSINKCPAYGKICSYCKNLNHFAAVCNKKKNANVNKKKVSEVSETVHEIHPVESVKDSCFHVGSITESVMEVNADNRQWHTVLTINNKKVTVKIDTGAMVNIIPLKIFKCLGLPEHIIAKNDVTLNSYTGDKLEVLGFCNIKCENKNKLYTLKFYVVNSNTESILGLESSVMLGLIMKIDNVKCQNAQEYSDLVKEYKDLFTGTGCLGEPYHISIDENVKPVIHPTRKVALPLLDSLKESLTELEKTGIIEKVVGASDWREGKEIKCFLELGDQSDESVIQTEHSVQQDSDSEYESVSNSVDNIPLESLKNSNVKNLNCERVLKPGSEEAFVLKEKVTSHGRISRPPRRLSY